MLTRCPDCQTLFRIRAETLRVAHGRVRCGRCGAEFNALDSLAEDPDDLNGAAAAAQEAAAQTPVVQAAAPEAVTQETPAQEAGTAAESLDMPRDTQHAALPEPDTDTGAFVGPLPEALGDHDRAAAESTAFRRLRRRSGAPWTWRRGAPEPDSTQPAQADTGKEWASPALVPELIHSLLLDEEPRRTRAGPRVAAGLVSLLLLAGLAGQWLYLQRVPLYGQQPQLRPVLERMCLWLHCELPLSRAPERIEIVERVVREHPRVAQALLVDLTFVSHAEGRIAYPVLELRLADLSGNRVAARRFTPAEYLPAPAGIAAGLPANLPVQVTLELLAPSLDVVSFQFDFL